VRGASALQDLLRRTPESSLRVLVVWEPVLWSDLTPPMSSVLGRVSDPRARQFWDRGRLVSAGLLRVLDAGHAGGEGGDPPDQDGIVWDAAAIFPAGALWDDALPAPSFIDGPVLHAIGEVGRRLSSPAAAPRP
jgi:hypothetical protein